MGNGLGELCHLGSNDFISLSASMCKAFIRINAGVSAQHEPHTLLPGALWVSGLACVEPLLS